MGVNDQINIQYRWSNINRSIKHIIFILNYVVLNRFIFLCYSKAAQTQARGPRRPPTFYCILNNYYYFIKFCCVFYIGIYIYN